VRVIRDAERPHSRSQAERGNEVSHNSQYTLFSGRSLPRSLEVDVEFCEGSVTVQVNPDVALPECVFTSPIP
jgi:hypothetical protein